MGGTGRVCVCRISYISVYRTLRNVVGVGVWCLVRFVARAGVAAGVSPFCGYMSFRFVFCSCSLLSK